MIDCRLNHIQRDKHSLPFRIRHTHSCYELTYFISGRGTTGIEDRFYPYRSKTFAVYRAGTVHEEIDPNPCQVIWMQFDFNVKGLELSEGVYEDPRGELFALLQRLRSVYLERGKHQDVLVEAALAQTLAIAARLQTEMPSTRGATDWKKVLNEIDENSNTDVDFAALAAKYHYSYDRFRHLFCEKFGMPPYAYLLNQRIEHAKLMLENTAHTLTEIAYDCGFSSSSQFTNVFKKHTGKTPGDYRKTFVSHNATPFL